VTRRGLGAVLATGGTLIFLSWLVFDPVGALARSSEAPIPPKEPQAAASQAAPEGRAVAVTPAEPMRLAANEEEAASPAKPEAQAQTATSTSPPRPGMLQVDTDQPLSITADELEAIEEPDGRRRLVFNRKVNVDQGGLKVQSDRLEAHYAPQASQPDRLVASGSVRVRQKTRELSCETATYYPAKERLECTGNALLRDGANKVSGKTIEILFGEDRIRVKGGAVVNVAPDEKKPVPAKSAEARPPEAAP
jgi:lipopolysaccharide transport protein LptA